MDFFFSLCCFRVFRIFVLLVLDVALSILFNAGLSVKLLSDYYCSNIADKNNFFILIIHSFFFWQDS